MNEDGHTSSVRDKILNITVRKGWLPDTAITFPNEGDQGPNIIPGESEIFRFFFCSLILYKLNKFLYL